VADLIFKTPEARIIVRIIYLTFSATAFFITNTIFSTASFKSQPQYGAFKANDISF